MLILVACSNNKGENTSVTIEKINASAQLSEGETDKLKVQNGELQAALENTQTQLNYKKEEADYYQQVIHDLIKEYSDTELKDLALQLWNYRLEINGGAVPSNGIVELQSDTIEVSLKESQPAYPVLPNDNFIQGQISGNYIDHLKMNSNPTETSVTDGTVVTAIHYKFEDVKAGTTISFTVTEELKKRLGLETNQISINKQ